MPLQPRFTLSQTDEYVIARVHTPHVRVGGMEVDVDGCSLAVYCKPYLLKLVLPGPLVNDERTRAEYDASDSGGMLTIYAPKEVPGAHFADLDLTARLLAPALAHPGAGAAPRGAAAPAPAAAAGGEEAELARALESSLSLGEVGGGGGRPPPRRIPPPLIEVLSSQDFETEAEAVSALPARRQPSESRCAEAPPPSQPGPAAAKEAAVEEPAASAASAAHAIAASLLLQPTGAAPPPPLEQGQSAPSSLRGLGGGDGWGYGFNRAFSGMFSGELRGELAVGLLALPDPEHTPCAYRTALRCAAEIAAWSAERYRSDFLCGSEEAEAFLACTKAWWRATGAAQGSGGGAWEWTEEEALALAGLPRKEYLIDGTIFRGACGAGGSSTGSSSSGQGEGGGGLELPQARRLFCGLVTLLFAYAHDVRFTDGDPSVESAWTICALSPLLSWLDDECMLLPAPDLGGVQDQTAQVVVAPPPLPPPSLATALPQVLLACVTRALTYPYLRRWDTALVCAEDAVALLRGGRRPVLRALLAIRRILGSGGDTSEGSDGEDHRYLLNTLFLNDYCVWVQYVSEEEFAAVAEAAAGALPALHKGAPQLGHLGLTELEQLPQEAEKEGEEGEEEDEDEDEDDDEEDEEEEDESN